MTPISTGQSILGPPPLFRPCFHGSMPLPYHLPNFHHSSRLELNPDLVWCLIPKTHVPFFSSIHHNSQVFQDAVKMASSAINLISCLLQSQVGVGYPIQSQVGVGYPIQSQFRSKSHPVSKKSRDSKHVPIHRPRSSPHPPDPGPPATKTTYPSTTKTITTKTAPNKLAAGMKVQAKSTIAQPITVQTTAAKAKEGSMPSISSRASHDSGHVSPKSEIHPSHNISFSTPVDITASVSPIAKAKENLQNVDEGWTTVTRKNKLHLNTEKELSKELVNGEKLHALSPIKVVTPLVAPRVNLASQCLDDPNSLAFKLKSNLIKSREEASAKKEACVLSKRSCPKVKDPMYVWS